MAASIVAWAEQKEQEKKGSNLVIGPDRELITELEFNKLTKHGCANCQCNLDVDEAENIEWREGNQPVCLFCTIQLEGGS